MNTQHLSVFLLLVVVTTSAASPGDILWPKPANFTFSPDGQNVTVSPCDIRYIVESPGKIIVQEMIRHYQARVFKCHRIEPGAISMNILVRSTDRMVATELKHQFYSLIIKNSTRWELVTDYYPGFLRGFQTFSQLFQKNQHDLWTVYGIPIAIEDGPQFIWRALMIDSSRHFMKVELIHRALDAMLHAKLNVLHWHITDQESFPLFIPNLPEISESGSLNGVYSESDVKGIIAYARQRGIRVIPEIDTPAHSQSWGRSEKYKGISINCNGGYEGQLNPTKNLTWQVLNEVLDYVNQTFIDDYVHFGGDEVEYECWNTTQINNWMQEHNINSYFDLSVDFRERQKQLWRTISNKKKVIYWANEQIDLPVQDDDVIQWWGVTDTVSNLVGRPNEVILSNYDLTYLDVGFGDSEGKDYKKFEHWRLAYSFNPNIPGVKVIGGASCMWNELGNKHTFDQKVLQRASVIGERLWNSIIDLKSELRNIATRLYAHGERYRERGYKVWPVTVGICEQQTDICF